MRFSSVAAYIAALHATANAMSVPATDTSFRAVGTRRASNGCWPAKPPEPEAPVVVPNSPIGTPFPVGRAGPNWSGRTGTSFLPAETIERAEDGNPIEKAKLAKDAS